MKTPSKTGRRAFLTGMLTGAGALLAGWAGVKAGRGGFAHLFSPPCPTSSIAEKQPFLRCILLGTGSPMSNTYRAKPANAVIAGNKVFLVDCGGGVVERMLAAGILPERVEEIFITHHHSDHNSGFADFFVSGWTGTGKKPRMTPLHVYGPTNTREIIGPVMDSLQWDISLRIRQAKNNPRGAEVVYHEQNEGVVYKQDGLTVTAFPVDHGIVKPALGYKFEYQGRSLVISGDTRPCDNMIVQAKEVDVLVHEAYSTQWTEAHLKNLPEAVASKARAAIESVMNYHSSALEAADIAERAGAKHLVFTHLMPPPSPVWYFERSWAAGVSDIYRGKVTVGRDLMVV